MRAYRDKPDLEPMRRDWRPFLMRLSAIVLLVCGLATGAFFGLIVGASGAANEGLKVMVGFLSGFGMLGAVAAYLAGAFDRETR